MRSLDSDFITELTSAQVRPVTFFRWVLNSSTIRLWTGQQDISWDSQTWLGNGWFRGVGSIKEVGSIEAAGVQINLTGVPQSLISTVLSEARQGAEVAIYFGFLNSAGAVVASPTEAFIGRFDDCELVDDPQSPSITISAESILIDLDKAKEILFTHEEQKINFPDDLGLQYVNSIQDNKWYWGRKARKKGKRRVKK
jgi:hypothetical protein